MEQEIQQVQAIYTLITEFFINYSFQIVGAIIILLLGILVARKVSNLILRLCERKKLDITLSRFIASATKILIVVMVVIIALGKVGISVTPFVAAIGALSLGAGLAIQGLLSNYGAGMNIILTRPFVVGDTIKVQDVTGQVREVHLAYTLLADEDDVEITIPNKHIIGEIIHNSHADKLVEETIAVAHGTDTDIAISTIRNALESVEAVSKDRDLLVGIEGFAANHVNIGVRFWVPTTHFFATQYRANSAIIKALTSAGISLPRPQTEVWMHGRVAGI